MLVVGIKKIVLVRNLKNTLRICAILLLGVSLALSRVSSDASSCAQKKIIISGSTFCATIADDAAERARGLSESDYIGDRDAMLFVFYTPSDYGMWMKDMSIPIDIIWLSEDRGIVHIEKNITPSTYPKIFRPISPAKYVIELRAGVSEELSIALGDKFSW